jgi:hypothetical protein
MRGDQNFEANLCRISQQEGNERSAAKDVDRSTAVLSLMLNVHPTPGSAPKPLEPLAMPATAIART